MERKKTVIIADADEAFRTALVGELERNDFQVVATVGDGEETVSVVREHKPDGLVLDMTLPKKDGISVLQELKGMGIHPAILATFSYITEYLVSAAENGGVGYFMLKPCEPSSVAERMEEQIRFAMQKPHKRRRNPRSNIEAVVTDVIHEIGVPAHIKGYLYLREAIILAVEDEDDRTAIHKVRYQEVAQVFDTTSKRVERAIRHAIEVAWDRGDLDTLQGYFGYTVSNTKGKPTNSEFIALVSDRIRLRIKNE